MKNTCFLALTIILFSCNTLKKTKEVSMKMPCPPNGQCEFAVLPNQTLEVLVDGIGMQYPKFSSSETSDVIKFTYKKTTPEGTVDGNYTEVVYVVIPKTKKEWTLKDTALQQAKVLYGRLCYCKGSTGYFEITDGNLTFKKTPDGQAMLHLTFKNHRVPQLIKEIKGTFKML